MTTMAATRMKTSLLGQEACREHESAVVSGKDASFPDFRRLAPCNYNVLIKLQQKLKARTRRKTVNQEKHLSKQPLAAI